MPAADLLAAAARLLQLPPKRRQVIRLPKPAASEWPKLAEGATRHADDSEGSASSASEDEGEEGAEDADGGGQSAKPMSAAHRTGLAKASSVIDWLMTALGARKSQRQQGGTGQKVSYCRGSTGKGQARCCLCLIILWARPLVMWRHCRVSKWLILLRPAAWLPAWPVG